MIRTAGKNFEEAKNGMSYELEADFEITDFIIDKTFSPEMISEKMNAVAPDIVVLMNNTAVSLFKKYQTALPLEGTKIPSVSLMSILVNDAIDGLQNATGIGYEIPVVTSSVNMRSIFGVDKVKKVGIVHREKFAQFVESNRKFCQNENISLITKQIGNDNVESDLKAGLQSLVNSGVDALWVPGDNIIVNKELLLGVWIPFLKENKLPVIVGVKNLVDPKFGFGTFAVLPDHSALGSQAASIVYDVMNNNWIVEENGSTQLPLSVYTILNFTTSRALFGITEDQIEGVDQVLQ